MKREVFERDAESMGDFYIYYQKKDSNAITFGIATTNLTTPHIANKLKKVSLKEDEVLLWNWRYDSPLKLPLSRIKKLTPLSAILQNE